MRKNFFCYMLFLLFLVMTSVGFSSYLYLYSASAMFNPAAVETDTFRKMQFSESALVKLSEAVLTSGLSPAEILTVLYPFCPEGFQSWPAVMDSAGLFALRNTFLKNSRAGYKTVLDAYAAIWDDVECFPVAEEDVFYENSWMFERTYGGARGHEGTDLMPPENLAGVYPVVSMTDGTVEKIGWLEQGGYRIGIRSDSGGYFYYAHLDSYAQDFSVGDCIYAGEYLGMMGDSGYGKEGTKGQFDVHLHLGIYIRTERSEEMSVNPYWVLRYAQFL